MANKSRHKYLPKALCGPVPNRAFLIHCLDGAAAIAELNIVIPEGLAIVGMGTGKIETYTLFFLHLTVKILYN